MTILPLDSVPGYNASAKALLGNETTVCGFVTAAQIVPLSLERRDECVRLIRESMQDVGFSPQQEQALKILEEGASCIMTGQQVGFLGGPLYTFYKAASVLSRVTHHHNAGNRATGVFWIEDNDHDIDEAASAWLYAEDGSIRELNASDFSDVVPGVSVSELHFNANVVHLGSRIKDIVGEASYRGTLEESIASVYRPGVTWSQAFLQLMNSWFADEGLLFVKASIVRRAGSMKAVIAHDLGNPGLIEGLVASQTTLLDNMGMTSMIRATAVNSFYHTNEGKRVKLSLSTDEDSGHDFTHIDVGSEKMSHAHVMNLIDEHPERFSPSVVTRPLVQDSLFGSSEYVAGPGEMAYLLQLCEVYRQLGIFMPSIVARAGATILSRRIERMMEKEKVGVSGLYRDWTQILAEITADSTDASLSDAILRLRKGMEEGARAVTSEAIAIDKTLEGAVAACRKAIEKELDQLEKKVGSAVRRKEDERIKRLRSIHEFIFPEEKPQERIFATVIALTVGGQELLFDVRGILCHHPCGHHYVVAQARSEAQHSS